MLWQKEEMQILLDAKNNDGTVKKNIKISGRSKKSVRRQLVKLGLLKLNYKTKKHNKKRWTHEELKVLHEAKDKLKIKLPGRTKNSLLAKLGRLKLIERQKARKPWLKKQCALLSKLSKEGKSAKEIFLLSVLPYSKNSIQKKMRFMGFTKKQKPSKYFSKETIETFKKFLQDNWQNKTPEDLISLWNESSPIETNRTKVIYHLTKLKIKIPYGEVGRIKRLRKKEDVIKESKLPPKELIESLRVNRAEIMRKRILLNRDLWTGLPLTEDIEIEESIV